MPRKMTDSTVVYELYARKSQEPDDRQALSIPAQTRECASKFPEIAPSQVTEESFSAKAPGRPLFDEMIDRIERGEIQGILAWHPDRLSRNSVDAGRIIYLLDTGKLKDLKFCSYTFENTPEGKWMLSMVMSQAKYQVDKLSIDVQRGNRQKYEGGGITWRAPQGYLNNKATLQIEPDPERFDLVRRMWDMLLSGAYTVPQIQRIANTEWNYRTRRLAKVGDRPLALSILYRLFRDPLYCALNVRPDGTVYECSHLPMVTSEEFWKVQKLLGKRGRPKPKKRPGKPLHRSAHSLRRMWLLIHCRAQRQALEERQGPPLHPLPLHEETRPLFSGLHAGKEPGGSILYQDRSDQHGNELLALGQHISDRTCERRINAGKTNRYPSAAISGDRRKGVGNPKTYVPQGIHR